MNAQEIEKNIIKDKKIIIYSSMPSFGDYLMWSSIPELLYKKYNLDVFISGNCSFHNNDVYNFLFETNPFVKGKTNEPYNVHLTAVESNIYYPEHYLKLLGLNAENIIPKIYYKPKKIDFKNNCILYNFSSRSSNNWITPDRENELLSLTEKLANKHNLKKMFLSFKDDDNTVCKRFPTDEKFENYVVNDLFEYADLLNSIKYYVGFNSGSSLLAGSIKEYFNPELQIYFFTYPCAGIYWNFPNFNIEFFDVHKKQMETDIELKKRMLGTDEYKI